MSTRARLAAALAVTAGVTAIGASSAQAAPADAACLRAGLSALRSLGVVDDVARDGLPISTAVALGVTPREGTDVSSLPSVLPLRVVLADHRAGDDSLFIYPWCG